MSRYEVLNEETDILVVVGWDEPLATYFAQVWEVCSLELDDSDDAPLLWVGCRAGEIRSVRHLERVIEPYATLPEDFRSQLTRDGAAGLPGGFRK